MGWTALDTALERIRGQLAEDPAGAADAIAGLLEEASSPSIRVRAFALLVGARRRLGDLAAALNALQAGREQPLRGRRSRFAQAELEWHAAELHLYRSDRAAGRRAADLALSLFRPLAIVPGQSKGARRKHRLICGMYAAALITSAQIAVHLEGGLYRALADSLEALRMADPRHAARVHLSAITAVSFLVTKIGIPKDVAEVLELAGAADQLLSRRVPTRHPHRLRLKGISALALARFGALEQAERILFAVVAGLRELGLDADADRAGLELLWVVGERAAKPERARYLRRSLGLPAAEESPPPPPDDPSPIGF